jgi:hypothetical protein
MRSRFSMLRTGSGLFIATTCMVAVPKAFLCLANSALARDPSTLAGVPILVAACLLLALRGDLLCDEPRSLSRSWSMVMTIAGCAALLIGIALGKVPLVWPGMHDSGYEKAHDLPALIGSWMGPRTGGPFFSPSPSWLGTLSMLLEGYAVLIVVTALSGLRVAHRRVG